MLTAFEADNMVERSLRFGWEVNTKGNHCRRWRQKILTVFKSGRFWKWCIRDEDGSKHYSRDQFMSVNEAIDDVCAVLANKRPATGDFGYAEEKIVKGKGQVEDVDSYYWSRHFAEDPPAYPPA